jgi:hypothetical protein
MCHPQADAANEKRKLSLTSTPYRRHIFPKPEPCAHPISLERVSEPGNPFFFCEIEGQSMFTARSCGWLPVAAAAAGLFLPSGCRRQEHEARPLPACHKWLPNDTNIVLSVKVTQIFNTPLLKKHVPVLKTVPNKVRAGLLRHAAPGNALISKLKHLNSALKGLDAVAETRRALAELHRCVQEFTVAGTTREDEPMLIYHGTFDRTKVEEAMAWLERVKPQGITVRSQESDKRAYHRLVIPGDSGAWFIALVDENNLIITPAEQHVTEALARAAGKVEGELGIQALLRRVEPRWSLWIAALVHDDVIADLIGGATVGEDIHVQVEVTAKTKGLVPQLCREINEDLAFARTFLARLAQDHKSLAPLMAPLAEVRATPGERTVRLGLRISAEVIDRAVAELDRSPAVR